MTGRIAARFVRVEPRVRASRFLLAMMADLGRVNARIRRAVRARGHFPTEQAALKCVYLAVMSLDPTGTGRRRWATRWKSALNAFDIAFDGRLSAARR